MILSLDKLMAIGPFFGTLVVGFVSTKNVGSFLFLSQLIAIIKHRRRRSDEIVGVYFNKAQDVTF